MIYKLPLIKIMASVIKAIKKVAKSGNSSGDKKNNDSKKLTNLGGRIAHRIAGKKLLMSYEEILARTDFTNPLMYVAMYDFTAKPEDSTQLSFVKGDRFLVETNLKSWYVAENISTGQKGHVPSSHLGRPRGLAIYRWYHGVMEREDADKRLMSGINGSYLIRESKTERGKYSISVKMDGISYHYRIHQEKTITNTAYPGVNGTDAIKSTTTSIYYISPQYTFNSVPQLVQFYSENSAANDIIINLSYQIPKAILSPISCPNIEHDKFEVDRRFLLLGKKLGSGQFGDVYRGVWKNSSPVAVKTMKETEDIDAINEFLNEAKVMKPLNDKYLLGLVCVCTLEAPFLIVSEYMPRGNLIDFLRKFDTKQILTIPALLYLTLDIANGMDYLQKQNIIHRDLAARNILIGANFELKVSDFGLSRKMIGDSYKSERGTKFPIRWTAMESLRTNIFSLKSDVWSFGIVLWEVCSYGQQPYKGKSINQVLKYVESGQRMERPEHTKDGIYQLMLDCTNQEPDLRPKFGRIIQIMKGLVGDKRTKAVLSKSISFAKKL